LGWKADESPECWLTALLIGAPPRAESTGSRAVPPWLEGSQKLGIWEGRRCGERIRRRIRLSQLILDDYIGAPAGGARDDE
jgi:hypothetical protein